MQGILVGVVAAFVVLCTIVGPEYVSSMSPVKCTRGTSAHPRRLDTYRNHGSRFEKYKAAFEEGAGRDEEMPDVEEVQDSADASSRAASIREVREKDLDV